MFTKYLTAWAHPFCLGFLLTPSFIQFNLSWFGVALRWGDFEVVSAKQ